jgi:hypothetical protein
MIDISNQILNFVKIGKYKPFESFLICLKLGGLLIDHVIFI